MLLSLDDLQHFLDGLHPDLVVFQNLTFANAAYMSQVLRQYEGPILLWTLREPVIDGGRLRLNSLTGAYSAANTMRAFGSRFGYTFYRLCFEGVKMDFGGVYTFLIFRDDYVPEEGVYEAGDAEFTFTLLNSETYYHSTVPKRDIFKTAS